MNIIIVIAIDQQIGTDCMLKHSLTNHNLQNVKHIKSGLLTFLCLSMYPFFSEDVGLLIYCNTCVYSDNKNI